MYPPNQPWPTTEPQPTTEFQQLTYVDPDEPAESDLTGIWRYLLERGTVGVGDERLFKQAVQYLEELGEPLTANTVADMLESARNVGDVPEG